MKSGRGTGPIVDGWFIPIDLSAIYDQAKQNKVDVLVGSNQDEGTFFSKPLGTTADQFVKQARQRFGPLAEAFLKLYPASSNAQAEVSQLASFRDEMAWHMRRWAQGQSRLGKAKAYLYYFTHIPPTQPGAPSRGATHGAETNYVFDNPEANWTDLDRQVADAISSYWVNFAANGDPNSKGLPSWPSCKDSTLRPMVLGDKMESGTGIDKATTVDLFDAYHSTLR